MIRHGVVVKTHQKGLPRPVADPWLHCASLSGTTSPWGRLRACLASASSSPWLRSGSAAPSAPQAWRPSYQRHHTAALSVSARLRRWGRQSITPLGLLGYQRRTTSPLGRNAMGLYPSRPLSPALSSTPLGLIAASAAAMEREDAAEGGGQPATQLERRRCSGRTSAPLLCLSLPFRWG
jgi:hypothetical protein